MSLSEMFKGWFVATERVSVPEYSHYCELKSEKGLRGSVTAVCYEDEEALWVSEGDYDSAVLYCPACGYPSRHESEMPMDDGHPQKQLLSNTPLVSP